MKILYIHSMMFYRHTWGRVAEELAGQGIELHFASQIKAVELLEENAGSFDLLLAELSFGMPGFQQILELAQAIPQRLPMTAEIPAGFSTVPDEALTSFRIYTSRVSQTNYCNGIRYLASRCGLELAYEPPAPVRTSGIYHPAAPSTFEDVQAYREWYEGYLGCRNNKYVGVLFYYSQLTEHNTGDVDALVSGLEMHGLAPLCVFCAGADDLLANDGETPAWLELFNSAMGLEAVLSLMAVSLFRTDSQVHLLEKLDRPVIQLMRSHTQTAEQWYDDPQGLPAMTAVYSLARPETCGVIMPHLIAGCVQDNNRDRGIGYNEFQPVTERIDTLCRRLKRWSKLRHARNKDKRVTIVLHNNPCKGVEATIGQAAGLDSFKSLARLLQIMAMEGYDVGNAPARGEDILAQMLERKAISEFRWTTVDEIFNKGGDIYRMGRREYQLWFDKLPQKAREKALEDWGEFPGQGMAWQVDGEDVLLITGLQYGNIKIMTQPKRGCYGAKCTGEVCRILHDPQLAPPHHWLATYKYINDYSDAVIHFGTEGALEFLPGKQVGLSDACFSELSIGDIPNLYVYVMDVTGDGMLAKRRGQAVLVDHLTPVYRPAPLESGLVRLEELLEQYRKARQLGEAGREKALAAEITPLLAELRITDSEPSAQDLPEQVELAGRHIALTRQALMPEGKHLLGVAPEAVSTGRMLATLLRSNLPGMPELKELAGFARADGYEGDDYDSAAALLTALADGGRFTDRPELLAVREFSRDIAAKLARCTDEVENLLKGLDGRYIPPGLSSSLNRGRTDVLPTGRNFYATDVLSLPTRAAWQVGCKMADKLLNRYLQDEGRFPESIGISLWSTDAFKSDGETLCQVLYLMGVRPVWDGRGCVSSTEVVPLEELRVETADGTVVNRPRVDVTIQTSGIMRDMVPNFCELLDTAVVTLSGLEEDGEDNFIRKHSLEQMEKLRRDTANSMPETTLRRMSTLRIFSSSPGSYGLGVGLALDASAWEKQQELAEVYINWGGYAYGFDPQAEGIPYGMQAHQLYADQLARVDVTYMKQTSQEYDLLDCSCSSVYLGGMATAVKAVSGRSQRIYWGTDSTDADTAGVHSLQEELQRISRAKLLNPAWIEHMRAIGYQGAQTASGMVNTLFKWSAMTEQVPKQLFDAVMDKYILDEENRRWMREVNPYALEEVVRRLLEAATRGLWQADEQQLEELRNAALDIEGDMEELMGEVKEEFQGGKVDVLTADQVDKWQMEWRLSGGAAA